MASETTRTHAVVEPERLRVRRYTLEVIEGPDAGLRLVTSARVVRVGTSPECDLEISDAATSRFHARIEADPRGHRVIDEDSKNGTFVDDLQVRDAWLRPGCRLRIGANVVRYEPGSDEFEIELARADRFAGLIGRSAAMREIYAVLAKVAPTDLTVLVEGESGTGKELVADALHAHSRRADGPFFVFDCSAVAPNLIESELFGHVKGAFTGAATARQGAFERASGGTLFLDEIGELPLDLQPKLLRALEQREVRPVGGDRPIKIDTRIVAATNRTLAREVEAGAFRQDLYYRLAVLRVVLPPLRRRTEDIPLLVERFLTELTPVGAAPVQVAYETVVKLQRHRWPGNVRELRNFVERAATLATDNRLETRFLVPPTFGDTRSNDEHGDVAAADGAAESGAAQAGPGPGALGEVEWGLPFKDAKARLIERFERAYWAALLDETGGNVSAAARIAGIHRKSAEYLLKKLDLRGDDP